MLQIRLMSTLEEINAFLHGGIIGGTKLSTPTYDLDGKTLVFTQPSAATVTFSSGGAQAPLALTDIIAQINASISGLARAFDTRLHLEEQSPMNGVAISGASTAAAILGFSGSGQSAVVINPYDGIAPRLLEVTSTPIMRSSYVLVLEV